MRIYRAKVVLPVCAPPIEDGAVAVKDGKILAVGRWRDLRGWGVGLGGGVEDLGEVELLPGFVNAHCHLEYTGLKGRLAGAVDFVSWLEGMIELKRGMGQREVEEGIAEGLRFSVGSGVTTLCDIRSLAGEAAGGGVGQLRVIRFLELIDVRREVLVGRELENFVGGLVISGGLMGGGGLVGLSPHAPYSASRKLYGEVVRFCGRHGLRWTTHVAETEEEVEMFCQGRGRLFDFLDGIGRDMSDVGNGESPLRMLVGGGLVPAGGILAHVNVLGEGDWDLLEAGALEEVSVVHCPGCHEFFGRGKFPLERFMRCGVNVCLGTDSFASGDDLTMTGQMRILMGAQGWVSPELAVRMATVNGGRALGIRLGGIVEGWEADLVALPYSGGDVWENVVNFSGEVVWRLYGMWERG